VAAPIQNTGTATNPIITLNKATSSVDGYLSSADFTTFAAKLSNFSTMTSADVVSALTYAPVRSVAGRTGVVTLTSADITDFASALLTKQDANANLTTIASLSPSNGQVIKWDGSTWIASADNSGVAAITSTDVSNAEGFVQGGNSFGASAVLGTKDAQRFSVVTSGTEKMTVLANGDVGIGTSAPMARLHTKLSVVPTGTVSTSGTSVFGSGTNFRSVFKVGESIIAGGYNRTITAITNNSNLTVDTAFGTNLSAGTPYEKVGMIIESGALGIGTTTPSATFDLQGDVAGNRWVWMNDYGMDMLNIQSNESGYTGISMANTYSTRSDWGFGVVPSDGSSSYGASGFAFMDRNVDLTRLLIDNSGNVGIGVTNPTAKLEVAGQIKITGGSPGVGKVLTSNGAGLATWQTPAATGVTSLTMTAPLTNSGTTSAPILNLAKATGSADGYLSS